MTSTTVAPVQASCFSYGETASVVFGIIPLMKKFVVTLESAIVVPMAFAQAVLPGYLADPKAKEVERCRAAWLLERNAR